MPPLTGEDVARYRSLIEALYNEAKNVRVHNFHVRGRLLEEHAADAITMLLAQLGHYPQPTSQ